MPPGEDPPRGGALSNGIAALVVTGIGVVCCAAFPLLIALAGGVAVAAVLGMAAGFLAAVVLAIWIVSRARR